MQINLNNRIRAVDIRYLLIKANKHPCNLAMVDKLKIDSISIPTEHYQFFQAYADFTKISDALSKPNVLRSGMLEFIVLQEFGYRLYQSWLSFQEFNADTGDIGFLDSVHEFLQEKYPKPIPLLR